MPIDKNGDRNAKPPEPRTLRGSLISFFLFLILFNVAVLPLLTPRPNKVLYSEFLQQVQQGKVAKVFIGEEVIRYSLKDTSADSKGQPDRLPTNEADDSKEPSQEEVQQLSYLTTPVAEDPNLIQLLDSKGVEFGALPPDPFAWLTTLLGWIVPPLIFIGLWLWILSRLQGAGPAALTVGKSKARIYSEGHTGVTFADVAGVDEAQDVARDIDQEVKQIVEGAHQIALRILKTNLSLLKDAAQQLLQIEVLEGDALNHYLNQVQAPPELDFWLRTGNWTETP